MNEDIKRLRKLAENYGTFQDMVSVENITKQIQKEYFELKIGDIFYGFCNGYFGRDSYEDKTVEAIGPDWILVRTESDYPDMAYFRNGVNNNSEMFQEWMKVPTYD